MAALRSLFRWIHAEARRRGALAASGAARARARGRALRAEAEAASSAAVACAQARARVTSAYVLRAQRHAGAAAAVAGRRLRQGSDYTVGTFLWVAYGESAPRTPSPMELLEKLALLIQRASHIENMVRLGATAREVFDVLSPWDTSFILAIVLRGVAVVFKNNIPTAPETSCPFIGIRSLEFDEFPVEEGLAAVLSLSARIGGVVMLFAGGLCISACSDLGILVVGSVGKDSYMIAGPIGDTWMFSESRSDEWAML